MKSDYDDPSKCKSWKVLETVNYFFFENFLFDRWVRKNPAPSFSVSFLLCTWFQMKDNHCRNWKKNIFLAFRPCSEATPSLVHCKCYSLSLTYWYPCALTLSSRWTGLSCSWQSREFHCSEQGRIWKGKQEDIVNHSCGAVNRAEPNCIPWRQTCKCLWGEICFCLVLKFTLSNTRFQSLRRLALKVTILKAFKVEPFCPQKWYLNRAVKIPRETNVWRHFGAKIVLTRADRKEKMKPRGQYCVVSAPNQQSCKTQHLRRVYECISSLRSGCSSEMGPVCPKTPTWVVRVVQVRRNQSGASICPFKLCKWGS